MPSSGVLPSQNYPAALTATSIPNLKDRLPKLEPRKRRTPLSNPTPVPETPTLPEQLQDIPDWIFKTPSRRILSRQDHELFLASPAYNTIVGWVFGLAEAVVDTPCSAPAISDANVSDAIKTLLHILDEAESFTKASPPNEQGGSRFGNKAFRGLSTSSLAPTPSSAPLARSMPSRTMATSLSRTLLPLGTR
ncbi:hypothetical protein NQ176_g7197 [Zarea fungicola]|uniref:Uncharacterized protein n=1 Tax=Zarea fungicola TaxID=93591 RepID=A0ACC1MZU8_9HYPO|nr:hypothetical protein NQ176_g7197 [Lecanicillium fungicola]